MLKHAEINIIIKKKNKIHSNPFKRKLRVCKRNEADLFKTNNMFFAWSFIKQQMAHNVGLEIIILLRKNIPIRIYYGKNIFCHLNLELSLICKPS